MSAIDPEISELMQQNQVTFTRRQLVYLKFKRLFDIGISFTSMLLLMPFFIVIGIIIKFDSPKESILFKQQRVGRSGQVFTLIKFRTMKTEAPSEVSTNSFVNAEEYITKVGAFLRKTSLDELPQLWNVLCGHMSLIGPRPLIVGEEEVHFLRKYYGLYQVRPGITGLAQVKGRDNVSDYEKVRWDRSYARHVSFRSDLKIMWATVVTVLRRDGVVDDCAHKEQNSKQTEG